MWWDLTGTGYVELGISAALEAGGQCLPDLEHVQKSKVLRTKSLLRTQRITAKTFVRCLDVALWDTFRGDYGVDGRTGWS